MPHRHNICYITCYITCPNNCYIACYIAYMACYITGYITPSFLFLRLPCPAAALALIKISPTLLQAPLQGHCPLLPACRSPLLPPGLSFSLAHKLVCKPIVVVLGADVVDFRDDVCHCWVVEAHAALSLPVLAGVGASRAFQDRKTGQDAPGVWLGHNSPIIIQAAHCERNNMSVHMIYNMLFTMLYHIL